MPPYQNESLHDMHALIQQLDTLNSAHAPDHLEMMNPFSAVSKAVTDGYNAAANSDFAMHQLNRATDAEVILYEYSQKEKKEDALNLLLMSSEIRAKFDELLKDIVKSPTFKPIIMQEWYSTRPITEQIQRDVYKAMNPPKK